MRHTPAEQRHKLVADLPDFQRLDVFIHRQRVLLFGKPQIGIPVARDERHGIRPVEIVLPAEMVKMQDVGLEIIARQHQVPGYAPVFGHLDAAHGLNRKGRRRSVRHRAHAADALYDLGGVAGVPPAQDGLESPEHAAGDPRIGDFAVLHLHLDLEMPFKPGNGIDGDNGLAHAASGRSVFIEGGHAVGKIGRRAAHAGGVGDAPVDPAVPLPRG